MTSNEQSVNIKILGVKQTVAALRSFEPDLYKAMNKGIRESLKPVRDGALGKYPKGKYSVSITSKKILGSVAAASGGERLATNWGDSAGGVKAAIFEFAGSKQPGQTPGAAGLIKSLTARYGQPGRFLWSTWEQLGPGVLSNIEATVKGAERDLQANLNAAGEAF